AVSLLRICDREPACGPELWLSRSKDPIRPRSMPVALKRRSAKASHDMDAGQVGSLWASAGKQLLGSRSGRIGVGIVLVMVLLAVFAPLIAPHSPVEPHPRDQFAAPSWSHPFGTDEVGRDLFSRVIYG